MATPRSLPEELAEEILLRFPPDDPARLVHAALVCKTWCAVVFGAGFRRRFREFHRAPPLLGFVYNSIIRRGLHLAEFVPICSLPASDPWDWRGRVVNAHHGRVLLCRTSGGHGLPWSEVLMVWNPTTDEQEEVPFPPVPEWDPHNWTATVLCAAGGPCDPLDCGRGPFLIVFVGYYRTRFEIAISTYSSSTASWSKTISSNQLPYHYFYKFEHVAHVETALYFGVPMADHILKFDLESLEISWIQLPSTCSSDEEPYVLTTTEGGGLELATIYESSKLYIWSIDVSQVDATWTQSRVIELKTLLPAHAVLVSPEVLGFTAGTGVIFVESNNVLFVIDLKTYKVIKEVSEASDIYGIVPYMSFYTPVALGPASIGEGP